MFVTKLKALSILLIASMFVGVTGGSVIYQAYAMSQKETPIASTDSDKSKADVKKDADQEGRNQHPSAQDHRSNYGRMFEHARVSSPAHKD